jgi:hypothetical protein
MRRLFLATAASAAMTAASFLPIGLRVRNIRRNNWDIPRSNPARRRRNSQGNSFFGRSAGIRHTAASSGPIQRGWFALSRRELRTR